jgi:hypothetical protein
MAENFMASVDQTAARSDCVKKFRRLSFQHCSKSTLW